MKNPLKSLKKSRKVSAPARHAATPVPKMKRRERRVLKRTHKVLLEVTEYDPEFAA